jgi:small conductance mechanosensitive channel
VQAMTTRAVTSTLLGGTAPIWERPSDFAVRVGLTALLTLLAVALAPRLARFASAVPVRVERVLGRNGRGPDARVVEERRGVGAGLGRVTLASVWLAALAATATIWLWDQTGFLPQSPRALATAAGYTITRAGISVLVLAVSLVLGRILEQTIDHSLVRGRLNVNLLLLAGRAMYVGTLLVGIVVILAVWGTGIVLPVALLGFLSVALSLALQDVLKNVVAGVYLLIERPFVINDYIVLPPYGGIVKDVQIRVTWLQTEDGQLVLVPNALLFSSVVINRSYSARRRVALSVAMPQAGPDGVDAAQEEIAAVIEEVPGVREEPAPEVILNRALAGKVELRATFWVPTQGTAREDAIVSEAMERLRERLPEAEITLAEAATSPV